MDADARRILELLETAVERAEGVSGHQEGLLERQEEAARAFAEQLQESTQAAEDERARLLAGPT